jgi:hypothetical protein
MGNTLPAANCIWCAAPKRRYIGSKLYISIHFPAVILREREPSLAR